MPIRISLIAAAVASLLTSVAFADGRPEVAVLRQCEWNSTLRLEQPTQIVCLQDLRIGPAFKVITQGYPFQILTSGNLAPTTDDAKLTIVSFDGQTPLERRQASNLFLYARSVLLPLVLEQTSEGENSVGRPQVGLEFVSVSKRYTQSLRLDAGALVRMRLNGDLVALSGPDFQFR